jgi:hypothetical protein
MKLQDIVAILQLGFAGFAAIMAILSYRLIRLQAARKNPNIDVITSLSSFTKYTLYLSIAVILSSSIERGFDYVTKKLSVQTLATSQQAQNCRESLTGLVGVEGQNRTPEKTAIVVSRTYDRCFDVIQSMENLK